MELGDLMISMSYLPSAERLTVVVIKARNLRVFDDTRNSSGETDVLFTCQGVLVAKTTNGEVSGRSV